MTCITQPPWPHGPWTVVGEGLDPGNFHILEVEEHVNDAREDHEIRFGVAIAREETTKIERLLARAPDLFEALGAVIHRCEQEGCGTSWAPLAAGARLLKEIREVQP